MKVLVTGASGFVGRALVARLAGEHEVIAASRAPFDVPQGVRWQALPDLAAGAGAVLPAVEAIVHLAAVAHVAPGADPALAARIRRVNAEAPPALARLAAAAGVRRFVFVSSVKALGERSRAPLTEAAPAAPEDAYGLAKRDAEDALRALECDLEVAIVRPPLVYGPGVRANFLQLVRWVRAGVPLPFGAIDNARSVVSVVNLADFLERALSVPAAAGRTLHVTDGRSVSTAELVRLIADGAGVRARLVPLPAWLLSATLTALGRGALATRLLGSLELDDTVSRALLAWSPPETTAGAIARTVGAID